MIASLKGLIKPFSPDAILIEVNQVGYQVHLPPSLLKTFTKESQKPQTFFIHTHVKEDCLDLYGFTSLADLQLFKLIINISGIGPKIGIQVIDKGVDSITQAVSQGDVDFFTTIPRLGRKNSQKLIIELKPKLGSLTRLDLSSDSSETQEIISALTGLGFTLKQAKNALIKITRPNQSIDQKISLAIKYLGKK